MCYKKYKFVFNVNNTTIYNSSLQFSLIFFTFSLCFFIIMPFYNKNKPPLILKQDCDFSVTPLCSNRDYKSLKYHWGFPESELFSFIRGRVIVTVVPTPRLLSISSVPLCMEIISSATARPIPEPLTV